MDTTINTSGKGRLRLLAWSAVRRRGLHIVVLIGSFLCIYAIVTEKKESFRQYMLASQTVSEMAEETVQSGPTTTGDVTFDSTKHSYIDHMNAVLKGCGDICRADMNGVPSLYHDYIEKEVDCVSLLSNPTIDAKMGDLKPPRVIPGEMLDAFTYNRQVGISPFDGGILNQRYLGKQVSIQS